MCSSSNLQNCFYQHDIQPAQPLVQSLLSVVIVKDGFRLALQACELLREVCVGTPAPVCLCVGSTCPNPLKSQHCGYIYIFFLSLSPHPGFLTLEHPGKFHFQGRAARTVHQQFSFSFFSLLSLLTKTQRRISTTTLLPGDGGLVFTPHM